MPEFTFKNLHTKAEFDDGELVEFDLVDCNGNEVLRDIGVILYTPEIQADFHGVATRRIKKLVVEVY